MKHQLLFSLLASLCLFSCQEKTEEVPIEILRLEKSLFDVKSPQEVGALMKNYPFLKTYLGADSDVNDSLVVGQLYANVSNAQLRQFAQELQAQFGDLGRLQKDLQQAFGQLKKEYPDFKPPKIVTAITGFMGSDLYVTDSLVVIGLDYFGGPKAKYRPPLYDYQLRRYEQAYLVPNLLFLMAKPYIKVPPQDQTLLADMIWFGKGYEFVKHIAPDTPDSLIIGYSQEQLDDVYASQQDI
ncbi:MAG: gliding motility protein, partial [Runella sp.]